MIMYLIQNGLIPLKDDTGKTIAFPLLTRKYDYIDMQNTPKDSLTKLKESCNN